jgi:hypothetical protein
MCVRLKVLTAEIRKPYFLALKRFLREEGVRGASDTPRSCKVYPQRELRFRGSSTLHLYYGSLQLKIYTRGPILPHWAR